MSRFYFMVALALIGGLTSAMAGEHAVVNVEINGQKLPATFLEEVVGGAELTQDQFAAVTGRILAQHAGQTRTESCASLCRAPNGQWGAAPLSVGAQTMCPITSHCPDGMAPTEISIHSHPLPKGSHYTVNTADSALGDRIGRVMRASDPNLISDEDRHGSGYVVTYQGTLLFYERKGRIMNLGNVNL